MAAKGNIKCYYFAEQPPSRLTFLEPNIWFAGKGNILQYQIIYCPQI